MDNNFDNKMDNKTTIFRKILLIFIIVCDTIFIEGRETTSNGGDYYYYPYFIWLCADFKP